jgi:ribosomal protein S18 acetylase RimI-like enzyme
MNIALMGALNLAEFVRSTAGRIGSYREIRGGVVVAGPVPVANGYVNAAIPTDVSISPVEFFDAANAFFTPLNRPFVLWSPTCAPSFSLEAVHRGLAPEKDPSPAMYSTEPVDVKVDLRVRLVDDEDTAAVFGDLCERGYNKPGMAWLLAHQQGYSAGGTSWYIAYDGEVPVSAACGFLAGETGGIYSVATPPEFRGRGFAASVTAIATNNLFEHGAMSVVLQASKMGFGVYERLGFQIYDHYERFTIQVQDLNEKH